MAQLRACSAATLSLFALFGAPGCPSPVYGGVPAELVCVEDCHPVTYTGCDTRRRCCMEITVMRPAVWWTGFEEPFECEDRESQTSDPLGLCVRIHQVCPDHTQYLADPYFGCLADRPCCDWGVFEDEGRAWPPCE